MRWRRWRHPAGAAGEQIAHQLAVPVSRLASVNNFAVLSPRAAKRGDIIAVVLNTVVVKLLSHAVRRSSTRAVIRGAIIFVGGSDLS